MRAHNNLCSRVVLELEKNTTGGCKNINKIANIRIFFFYLDIIRESELKYFLKKGIFHPFAFPSDSSTVIVRVIYAQACGLKIHWATEHKSLSGAAYELITADTCSYNSWFLQDNLEGRMSWFPFICISVEN